MDYNDIINKMNSVDESFINKWSEFSQSWLMKTWEEYFETEDDDIKPHLSYKYVQDQLNAKSEIEKSACIGFVASLVAVNRDRYNHGEDPNLFTSDIPPELVDMAYTEIVSRNNKKSGCFIATAVFGDYDSKEVMLLRNYKDNVLDKSLIGRIFINTYYMISPSIALVIKRNDRLLLFAKKLLLRIIDIIRTDQNN